MTITAHIRDRQPRVRGNGYYLVRGHNAPNLCGAPYTTDDLSYGDIRWLDTWLAGRTVWQNGCADGTGSSALRDVTLCVDCRARYDARKAAKP